MWKNFFRGLYNMFKIIDIFKIGICSFCESVFMGQSLDKNDFKKYMKIFSTADKPLDVYLNNYSNEYAFDAGFPENVCREYCMGNKKVDKNAAYDFMLEAFFETILNHKTIDIGAYMHVLLEILINNV